MRLRIDLAYDGAPFHGFARQGDVPTVQDALEDVLGRLLDQQVRTVCAGRTDRGVHALAQVVHLDLDPAVPAARRAVADLTGTRDRLDRMLGDAVAVWTVREVPDSFDARFSAVSRAYRYRIADVPVLSPLRRFDVWHLGERLGIGAMRIAARHLVGEHDFASLCRARPGVTTVRRIDRLTVSRPSDGLVHLRVRGRAFCHQQVRSIVAVLAEVGAGRRRPEWAGEVLAARDRSVAPAVAPPQGLTLERVSYGRGWPAAPPPEVRASEPRLAGLAGEGL
jgi:tRNA pseudouridine38-40 synthase